MTYQSRPPREKFQMVLSNKPHHNRREDLMFKHSDNFEELIQWAAKEMNKDSYTTFVSASMIIDSDRVKQSIESEMKKQTTS